MEARLALWWRGLRQNPVVMLVVAALVLIGMWSDRFMVLVSTQVQDFLPSAYHGYSATFWGIATFAGSAGLFATLLLLAVRYLPMATMRRDA